MVEARFTFPKGFLWGTATSSHQVEGNNKNNQWAIWEDEGERIDDNGRSGLACDWWGGKWKDDFDRAAESGQNAHRLSIEWSRIQPSPDRWDEDAIDHYRQMIRGLRNRGIEPMVTLHHFSDPLWLTDWGAWENEKVIDLFTDYSAKVVEALKNNVNLWVTLNEPNVYVAMGYVTGEFPPGKSDLRLAMKVMENMAKAHAAAYHRIKEIQPESMIGLALNWRGFSPKRRFNLLDQITTKFVNNLYNEFFPQAFTDGVMRFPTKKIYDERLVNTQDFIGLNFYCSELISFKLSKSFSDIIQIEQPDGVEVSVNDFVSNQPLEFFKSLKWANQFNKPIFVTENGTEDSGDDFRRRYLTEHIHQLWRAVNFNYPIRGYFYWSLVDNFEWSKGWTSRFGLWELDENTQARKKRLSADLYASICKHNALRSEDVKEFVPELTPKLFPE